MSRRSPFQGLMNTSFLRQQAPLSSALIFAEVGRAKLLSGKNVSCHLRGVVPRLQWSFSICGTSTFLAMSDSFMLPFCVPCKGFNQYVRSKASMGSWGALHKIQGSGSHKTSQSAPIAWLLKAFVETSPLHPETGRSLASCAPCENSLIVGQSLW